MKKQRITTMFPSLDKGNIQIHGSLEIYISGITHDSRQVQQDFIFCAVKLHRTEESFWYSVSEKEIIEDFFFNHENFIEEAISRGAIVIVTEPINLIFITKYPNFTFVLVDHVINFLGEQASTLSKILDDEIIAVTGSAGKTTCVRVLESVISELFPEKQVIRMYKYRLTPITLPLMYFETLLGDKDFSKRTVILEMATDNPGCINTLCSILQPTISVVLNVEDAHINIFGSQDAIAKAKSEIVLGTKSGGVTFLNANDPYVLKMKGINPDIQNIIYGDLDNIHAKIISFSENMDSTTVVLKNKTEEQIFKSSFISLSMNTVFSVVASIACYLKNNTGKEYLGLVSSALSNVQPLEGRMSIQTFKIENSNNIFFDNTAKMNSSNLQKLIHQVFRMPLDNYYKILILSEFRSNDHKDPGIFFWNEVLIFFNQIIFVGHKSHEDDSINYVSKIEDAVSLININKNFKNFFVVAGRSTSEANQFISLFKSLNHVKQ